MPSYQEVTAADKTYILVHGGIRDFEESKPLEQYKLQDFIYERTDYERRYYSDPSIYLVTGHTPTQLIRKDMEPLIYEGAGHIAVDCGCVFGIINSSNNLEETDRNAVPLATGLGWVCANIFWGVMKRKS